MSLQIIVLYLVYKLIILTKLYINFLKYLFIKIVFNRKTCKLLIISGFVYQLIDLTIDYLSFKHKIDVNLIESPNFPAVTFCFERENYIKFN